MDKTHDENEHDENEHGHSGLIAKIKDYVADPEHRHTAAKTCIIGAAAAAGIAVVAYAVNRYAHFQLSANPLANASDAVVGGVKNASAILSDFKQLNPQLSAINDQVRAASDAYIMSSTAAGASLTDAAAGANKISNSFLPALSAAEKMGMTYQDVANKAGVSVKDLQTALEFGLKGSAVGPVSGIYGYEDLQRAGTLSDVFSMVNHYGGQMTKDAAAAALHALPAGTPAGNGPYQLEMLASIVPPGAHETIAANLGLNSTNVGKILNLTLDHRDLSTQMANTAGNVGVISAGTSMLMAWGAYTLAGCKVEYQDAVDKAKSLFSSILPHHEAPAEATNLKDRLVQRRESLAPALVAPQPSSPHA